VDMSPSSSHLDDGSMKLPNGIRPPAEQEVKDSDLASSPSTLRTAATAAVTPDSIDTSSRSRPRANSVSSDGSNETGNSRLQELRSQRNAKLGALKERIKSSQNTLSTPAQDKELASEANSQGGDIQIGNSTDAQNFDNDPTSKLDEFRARRKRRLEGAGTGNPLGTRALRQEIRLPAGSPPPVITLNGTGVQVQDISPSPLAKASDNTRTFSDDGHSITGETDMMSESASVENDKANTVFRRLSQDNLNEHNDGTSSMSDEILRPSPARQGSVRSVDGFTPNRKHALRSRSCALSVDAGMTNEIMASLSKLDRLRLRQAQSHEKAQMELAAFATPRLLFGAEQSSGESSAPKQVQHQMQEQTNTEQLTQKLHDAHEERTKLKRQLEASREALQLAREEKLSDAKNTAGAENERCDLCNMIDKLQGQVDELEEKKTEDNIRLEEALHKSRLEAAQLKEQVDEIQGNLNRIKTENQELNHQKELQLVRHAEVTKMWEYRAEGLVSQVRDLRYSLQDLSNARLQERSDLLRHVVLLQKENQRLRNGGIEGEKKFPRIRFWKPPGIASSFGNPLMFMPFGSLLLGQRHRTVNRTVKATGDIWHPMKPATNKSVVKPRRRVSNTLWNKLVAWDTVKNVAWGAGIMGLVLMSSDSQITHDSGPFVRLEIPTPLFKRT